MDKPSQAVLHRLFEYEPQTGALTWRESRWRPAGAPAGWDCGRGYQRVFISGKTFYAHRVIWCWMTGEWPRFIDHKDLDKSNNRWSNLRDCSKTENQGNRPKRSDNTSGIKGIGWDADRQKWRAQISKGRQHFFIGRFKQREDAASAYASKARELYGDFARLS